MVLAAGLPGHRSGWLRGYPGGQRPRLRRAGPRRAQASAGAWRSNSRADPYEYFILPAPGDAQCRFPQSRQSHLRGSGPRPEMPWRNGQRTEVENVQANYLYEIDEHAATLVAPKSDGGGRNTQHATFFTDASHLLNHTHHEELFDDYARQPLLMKQLSQF